ncbi:hypothetical protein Q5H91_07915 [Sphingomonas sp. KR1UV-12]|uniref:Inner membrane protein n=1 Tax=Sphingomonas aurea TaxID=3063994 RepID=A0ABT9EK14_9SPHN|nr:hypothetical protein [Sphingomonas sp. KR1UV-12]MDP1027133.1 hypothetical protein [Sphingomonas sp. KR1UV-12]
MSSHPPYGTQPPRRRAWVWIALLVILAFVIGGVATSYAIREGYDWGSTLHLTGDKTKAVGTAEAPGFVPAQPLGAAGEAPAVDPAALVSREAALAGQLTALEARAAAIATDAAAAGAQATRAEALMVAFAARRAIDRGTGLGYLEEQLRTRFVAAQPRAVAVVIQAARTPVTTEDLRQGLDAIAPTLQTGADTGWLTQMRRELGHLVVLREEGTPSAAPVDRLARARRLLDDGQVDAARAEVARLPGAAQAGAWLAAARRYALAHQALDVIETAAILGQAQGAQQPVRTTTPPPITTTPTAPVVSATS